jgi:hypothetical protein
VHHHHLGLDAVDVGAVVLDDIPGRSGSNSDTRPAPGRYLANSAIASSASTPPVMEIGTKAVFAATSALEIMI